MPDAMPTALPDAMPTAIPNAMPPADARTYVRTYLRRVFCYFSYKKCNLGNARGRFAEMPVAGSHDPALRAVALTVPCTYCQATIGEPCRNKSNGKPLQFPAAHISRINAAIEVPF